jgi:dTDP-4-dehydrorhamnose 3,5-epimerase
LSELQQLQAAEVGKGHAFPELRIWQPRAFGDERGWFMETWTRRRYEHDSPDFVQDNASWSQKGILRGLHFQHPHAQAKLVSVLVGEVFDVVVDVRLESPTFGRWFGCVLSVENRRQLLCPGGFAHGFLVTSPNALVHYKTSDYYEPASESIVSWSDPQIGIEWPAAPTGLSPRDAAAPRLREIDPARLPR